MTQPDVTPQDALEIAQRALRKANEVDELEDRIDDLEAELTSLKLKHEEATEQRDYDTLSLDEKVGRVRQHAYERARDGHGTATLDYKDVMYGAFEGQPGAKHCYKLMRLAAGIDDGTGSNVPGFTFRNPDGDSYQLAVKAERAKTGLNLFPENKTEPAGAD